MLKRFQKLLCFIPLITLSLITGCVNKSSDKALSSQMKVNTVAANEAGADKTIPKYSHIFVIIAENKAYSQMIASSTNTPNLTSLANTYGLATNFYGEVHPSEANYIAMLGGSTFGIHDDDAYYCTVGSSDRFCHGSKKVDYVNHTIDSRSLMNQLEENKLTWKGYFEDIPTPGSSSVVYPDARRALYASKHNGFMNFKTVQNDPDIAKKIVGLNQLATDLESDSAPNYSHIILNQCDEMHGLAECPNMKNLIAVGDKQIGGIVAQIQNSKLWKSSQNNAIVITWDEDDNPIVKSETQGCCGFDPKSKANFGGGHIATIVITNHGLRHVVDATPYNHYSLLRTTEDAFGIHEYLNYAGDTKDGVKPMTNLFATAK